MQENIPVVKSETKIKSRRVGVNIFKTFTYILIFAIGIAAGISVAQQKPGWFGLNQGAAAAQAEVDATVAKVGKLIALPTDEKPTVATVTDASKVSSQPFFQNAKNGDVVLIYTKAQKAILYSPSENKIVEVGAVNINNQVGAVQTPTPVASPTPKAK
jgi:hypothetical protein